MAPRRRARMGFAPLNPSYENQNAARAETVLYAPKQKKSGEQGPPDRTL
jgi:hypothetical protein